MGKESNSSRFLSKIHDLTSPGLLESFQYLASFPLVKWAFGSIRHVLATAKKREPLLYH